MLLESICAVLTKYLAVWIAYKSQELISHSFGGCNVQDQHLGIWHLVAAFLPHLHVVTVEG
jgi:hypothetical protein